MKMRHKWGSAMTILAFLLSAFSLNAEEVERQAQIQIQEVMSILEMNGFHHVRKIEFEHDAIEIEAKNSQGQKVDIELDLVSGAILEVELD